MTSGPELDIHGEPFVDRLDVPPWDLTAQMIRRRSPNGETLHVADLKWSGVTRRWAFRWKPLLWLVPHLVFWWVFWWNPLLALASALASALPTYPMMIAQMRAYVLRLATPDAALAQRVPRNRLPMAIAFLAAVQGARGKDPSDGTRLRSGAADAAPQPSLPGERVLTTYRDGQLTLSDRRVSYSGLGRHHQERAFVWLDDVASIRFMRRWHYTPWPATVPFVLFAAAYLFLLVEDAPRLTALGFLAIFSSVLSVPFCLFAMYRPSIHVATAGGAINIMVPRGRHGEAVLFVTAVEHARAKVRADTESQIPAPPGPTATRFVV